MNDKNLDELLSGLKQEYERMPEQVDKRTILQRIFRNEKKPRFGKVMPLVAIIAGLILFMLVALPYVGDYDQAENNPNYLEMYYLNALEDFKESLGLEDVEEFGVVTHAESVVEHYGSSPDSKDYEAAKEEIDKLLTTPKEIVEEAKSKGEFFADDEQFNIIMTYMDSSFQNYFSDLLVEYSIQQKDQDAILSAQDNPENYQGPREIKDFLIVLEEQGFRVSRQDGVNQLWVGRDFSWQLEHSEGLTGNEGYMHYLELMTDITEGDIPWNEMDSILLEIEYIYDTYPDEREAIFQNTSLLSRATNYLREYLDLVIPENEKKDPEVLLEEYNNFLEAHENSRFWEYVKARADTLEMTSTNYSNMNIAFGLYLLFNEQFEGITFNDIVNLNYDDRYRAQDIQDNYAGYSETEDENMLENLDPAEMVLLYKYAFKRSNAGLYSTLFAEESQWIEYDPEELHEILLEEAWMDVFEHSRNMVIQEGAEGDSFTATFIIYNDEVTAQMEWVKEDDVWKLLDQQVKGLPQLEYVD